MDKKERKTHKSSKPNSSSGSAGNTTSPKSEKASSSKKTEKPAKDVSQTWQESVASLGNAAWDAAAKAGDSAKTFMQAAELYNAMDDSSSRTAAALKEANDLRGLVKRVGYKVTSATLIAGLPPAVRINLIVCDAEMSAEAFIKSEEGEALPMRKKAIIRCLQSVDKCKPTADGSGFYVKGCALILSFLPKVEVEFGLIDSDEEDVPELTKGLPTEAEVTQPLAEGMRATPPKKQTWKLFGGSKASSSKE